MDLCNNFLEHILLRKEQVFKTAAAVNSKGPSIAKTSHATFNKSFINHKNPMCKLILSVAWTF